MKTRATYQKPKSRLVLTTRGWAVIVIVLCLAVIALATALLSVTPFDPSVDLH